MEKLNTLVAAVVATIVLISTISAFSVHAQVPIADFIHEAETGSDQYFFSPLLPANDEDQRYDNFFRMGGFDHTVRSAVEFKGELYVGGFFEYFDGENRLNRIARWDAGTQSWHPVGAGFLGVGVFALTVHDGELYAAGFLSASGNTPLSNVARWDEASQQWMPVGSGLNLTVYTMVSFNGSLYTGGFFTSNGDGVSINRVARFDGTDWVQVGAGFNNVVLDMTVFNDELYAAGSFILSSPNITQRVAKLDSEGVWRSVGNGLPDVVQTLTAHNGKLYAGGAFSTGGYNRVAVFDPDSGSWSPAPGSGFNGLVSRLGSAHGNLYASGNFSQSGTTPVQALAVFSGEAWEEVPGADIMVFGVETFLEWNGDVLFTGRFWNSAGTINHVAVLSGAEIEPLGEISVSSTGVDDAVRSVVNFNGDLVIGGSFARVGNILARGAARFRFDTGEWEALGDLNNRVDVLFIDEERLFAGGMFTSSAGVTLNRVAEWDEDAQNWKPLGAGIDAGGVTSFTMHNGRLVAAGSFTSSAGVTLNNIAVWDEELGVWNPLGLGVNGLVNSMLSYDGRLFAGGFFSSSGELTTGNMAWWDENTGLWNKAGAGISGLLIAMREHQGKIYLGGNFQQTMDGMPLIRAAVFDPETEEYAPLGNGFNNNPWNITVYEGELLFYGFFSASGDTPLSNIARWNQTSGEWESVGTGSGNIIYSSAEFGDRLILGGNFLSAGNKAGTRLTSLSPRAVNIRESEAEVPLTIKLLQNYPNPFNPTTRIPYSLDHDADVSLNVYDITGRRVASLVHGRQSAGSYQFLFDASGLAGGMYIYRLQADGITLSRKMMLVK